MTRTSAFARLSSVQGASVQGVGQGIAAGVVLLLAAVCWVPHLPAPLWLDETLTYWVVRDGLAETLERTLHYQPQPGYYVFVWLWTRIAGTSEMALRLPSLLAALGACFALARLGTRLTRDRETGLIAAVVLASSWNVYRESVDARSYMLGLVVLLCLALCLLRWIESGRWRDALLVGILGAVLLNLHVFFVLVYPALLVHAVLRWPEARGGFGQVASIAALLLLGALLFLPVGLELIEHGGSYSFVPPPQWRALFDVFAWGAPIAGLLAGTSLAGLVPGARAAAPDAEAEPDRVPAIPFESAWLLAIWLWLPLLLLFGVSMWTQMSIFLGRYLIPAIPAVALFYAMALRRIRSGPARMAAVVVVALAAFVMHERPPDDFRGAARAVNEFVAGDAAVPVLFASGLIEGEDEAWLRDPVLADYLNAPAEYYPLDGRLVTVPRRLAGHTMRDEIVDPILRTGNRFAAVEWFGNGARILSWLTQRAEGAGYRVVRRGFGGVRVAFFSPAERWGRNR